MADSTASSDVIVPPAAAGLGAHQVSKLGPGQFALLQKHVRDRGHVQLCSAHHHPIHELLLVQGAGFVTVHEIERLAVGIFESIFFLVV